MPYGISVNNDSGNLIISQDYRNYHLISTGTISNGGSWPSFNWSQGEQMYIRASSPGATLSSQQYFGGSMVFTVSAGVMEYVIIKLSPSPSSTTYGLRVYASDGTTIAYDSGRAPAKVVSSYTKYGTSDALASTWSQTLNQPFAVPTGRKRYISSIAADIASMYFDYFQGGFVYTSHYVTWNSDMQQVIGMPSQGAGGWDPQTTKLFLTLDI